MFVFTERQQDARGETRSFQVGSWVWANAIGLAVAYGLFALFADLAESTGAPHGGVVHGLSGMSGMVIGGALFVVLRHRAMAHAGALSPWTATAAGVGLAVGFVIGFLIAGPPFDFVLGVVTLGTIGGGLQWRINRHRIANPGRLLTVGIAAWFAAAVAALAVAVLLGDAIDALVGGGTPGFVAVTFAIGLSAGLVAALIEGPALRRRLSV